MAPDNGDAYFAYGRALLQSAIQQNTVLGDSGQDNKTTAADIPSTKPQESSAGKNIYIYVFFF